jgi:hypothetical protein
LPKLGLAWQAIGTINIFIIFYLFSTFIYFNFLTSLFTPFVRPTAHNSTTLQRRISTMLFSVTSIIFILCTTPSLVFSTEPCGKTGYGETRKNPCLCLGGFGDSNGKDAVCELGQVCTKGIYDSDTRNGTDAVCSLPIPCTDIDNRVPEGCIPSLCKGTDGGENNCRIGPCKNLLKIRIQQLNYDDIKESSNTKSWK